MAFTEAQLLAELQDSGTNPEVVITQFIVGATTTDVYCENNTDTAKKTGPMVQVLNSLTAAQAHTAIDTAMGK
jgi:hypothetical protein